ncbi:MAG: AmmeMemoRadiSam system protein B [bacterium]
MMLIQREDVRLPAVADLFYPGDPSVLSDEIEHLMEQSETVEVRGEIKALICPHAGYIYSGRVAATAYKLLKDSTCSVVAIISPSHHEYFKGVSVFNGRCYKTPLGEIPISEEYAENLISQDERIVSSWAGHRNEHALEVQLPFLQKVLPHISIIPIVMGDQTFENCQLLGKALAEVLKNVPSIIVASSDLSHHHPYSEAKELDERTCDLLNSYDEIRFKQALDDGTIEACGGGPILAAMIASKQSGARSSKVLIYKNSGDVTGEHGAVVGYLAAVFGNLN